MKQSKNLSGKIQEILTTATVRQKALIICRQYEEKTTLRQQPLLTKEEADAIYNSITPEQAREYNRYVRCYRVYCEFIPTFGLARSLFRDEADITIGLLRLMEARIQEENHLNIIYQAIKETDSAEAVRAFEDSLKALDFTFSAGAAVSLKDGYIEVETDALFEVIKRHVKDKVTPLYTEYKAIITAIDDWAKGNRVKAFMPDIMKYEIEDAKNDSILNVPPEYSRRELQRKIDSGAKVTETERERAIFPSYEEITPSEEQLKTWEDKINDIENN